MHPKRISAAAVPLYQRGSFCANASLRERGFTLVELAITLTIIGLLLAGVMKGTELMENARVAATVSQLKQHEDAMNSFKKTYGEFPGDFRFAVDRLANCTSCSNGDGNGIIDIAITSAPMLTPEARQVWRHLAAARLITSIDPNYTGTPNYFGVDYPKVSVGGMIVGYWNMGSLGFSDSVMGHYFYVRNMMDSAFGLKPTVVAKIDRKMDNGMPMTGDVVGWGTGTGPGGCSKTTGTKGIPTYDETNEAITCGALVYINP